MTRDSFKKTVMAIAALEGAVVGVAVASRQPTLALVTFLLAFWLVYFLKTRVKGVLQDEMILLNSGKAALRVYHVFGVLSTAAGIFLLSTGQGDPVRFAVGMTLTVSALCLMLLFALFYAFYTRKLRGSGRWK